MMWKSKMRTFVALVLILCGFVVSGISFSYVYFLADSARIERLRVDIHRMHFRNSSAIMGQIVECNQKIAFYRQLNSYWAADLFIPDFWESIPFIEFPERYARP